MHTDCLSPFSPLSLFAVSVCDATARLGMAILPFLERRIRNHIGSHIKPGCTARLLAMAMASVGLRNTPDAMHVSIVVAGLAAMCKAATTTAAAAGGNSTADRVDRRISKRFNRYTGFNPYTGPPLRPSGYSAPNWPLYHCGCNNKLDERDLRLAKNGFYDQLHVSGSGLKFTGKSMYSISGSCVVFACRWNDTNKEAVTTDIITQAMMDIWGQCGGNTAGTVSVVHNDKKPQDGYGFWLGYMRYEKGLDFCKGADSSPARDCFRRPKSTPIASAKQQHDPR